jgi:hypothetical protein
MGITHAFTNPKEDGGDTTIVRPSDWNADHVGVPWSPDTPPETPSAYDDEFDAFAGWTTLGSIATLNATDIPSCLHMAMTGSGTNTMNGIYKAAPATSFTVTCRISDKLVYTNYQQYGLMVTETSPGKVFAFGEGYVNGLCYEANLWTNITSRSENNALSGIGEVHPYLRLVVTSSSSVTCQSSLYGMVWQTLWTGSPGLTPANVGLWLMGWGTPPLDAYFDWIRFT